jgi:hypothetical protein
VTCRSLLPFFRLHRGTPKATEWFRSAAETPSLASLPGTRRHPRVGPICLPPRHALTTTTIPLVLGSPEPRERGRETELVPCRRANEGWWWRRPERARGARPSEGT